MAANAKQGAYLMTFLVGFTAFPAGLVEGGGLGMIVAVAGLALLAYSAVGFIRIKGIA